MQKKLAQLLASAKNTPELGKLAPSVKASVRARLLEEIGKTSVQAVKPSVFDYIRAPFHNMDFRSVMQPVTALGVVLAVSVGWVGSVFASINSVPGDVLYNLKIASERAQLSLADSADSRTRLHIEFANRRAEEVSQLLEAKKPDHEERVKVAMGNLKTELQTVSEHLTNIKDSDKESAVSLAKLVDRKVGGLEQAIDASLEGATDSVKMEAAQVKDVVQTAGDQALTVLVKEDAVPETSATAAEALEKKATDRVAEARSALVAKAESFAALQVAFSARVARLPILSEEDRTLAGKIKEAEAQLKEAQIKIEVGELALSNKDLAAALDAAAKADEFQVPVDTAVKTPEEVKEETEVEAPASETETQSELPAEAPANQ